MASERASIERIARECVGLRIRRLNRVVTRMYDDALRPLALKASQMNILVATWKLGVASPKQLCRILELDPSTLSRNVDRMRAKGWLEVAASDDAREQPLRLTASGSRLVLMGVPRWREAQEQAMRLIGADGIALLRRMTGRMEQNMAARKEHLP